MFTVQYAYLVMFLLSVLTSFTCISQNLLDFTHLWIQKWNYLHLLGWQWSCNTGIDRPCSTACIKFSM